VNAMETLQINFEFFSKEIYVIGLKGIGAIVDL
jgi:hypothetical protein